MDWFEQELAQKTLAKRAAFHAAIKSPMTKSLAVPKMSKEAMVGTAKLANMMQLLKMGQFEEEDLVQQAAIDPQIQAALDYEQAINENAALRQMTQQMQQQQQQMAQQMQQQQQQLMQAQQQTQQQQQQIQMAEMGKQQAIEQAIQAKNQQLSTIVEQQQHREQVMQAADALANQLKTVAATSPTEQQQQMAQQQAVQQQAELAAMPKKVQEEVRQAQSAQAEAQEQVAEAEQEAAQTQLNQQTQLQQQGGIVAQASAGLFKTAASGAIGPKVKQLLERLGHDPRATERGGKFIDDIRQQAQKSVGPETQNKLLAKIEKNRSKNAAMLAKQGAAPSKEVAQAAADFLKLRDAPVRGNAKWMLGALGLSTAASAGLGALPYIRSKGGKTVLPDKKRLGHLTDAENKFERELETPQGPSAKTIHQLRKAETALAESRRRQEDLGYSLGKGALTGLGVGGLVAGAIPSVRGGARAFKAFVKAPKFIREMSPEQVIEAAKYVK